ncbi:MAG: DNA translocase FtsK [Peptoniphilaceae bacterium]|nr:DNA translocase FtsK [Peptoniphilaceae bacterium]MDY5766318.1 DNA translocase FtsK [Peptoniphilaceae bacterium]
MAGRSATKRKKNPENGNRNIIIGIALVLFFTICASVYFRSQTGFLGKSLGSFFFKMLGFWMYFLPPLSLLIAIPIALGKMKGRLRTTVFFLCGLYFCALLISGMQHWPDGSLKTTLDLAAEQGMFAKGSGLIGAFFTFLFMRMIGKIGIVLFTILIMFFFFLHLMQISLIDFFHTASAGIARLWNAVCTKIKENAERRKQLKQERASEILSPKDAARQRKPFRDGESSVMQAEEASSGDMPADERRPIQIKNYMQDAVAMANELNAEKNPSEDTSEQQEAWEGSQLSVESLGFEVAEDPILYTPPPIELLKTTARQADFDESVLKKQAAIIEKTLDSFGIQSEVVSIQRGPAVALFELKPQAGVKVSRITNLADDLALALAAQDIRIEAPIPGKPYVGIEVPNPVAETVGLREQLLTEEFTETNDRIPVALGQSIEGKPVIAQIAKMPHLLIAGTTGSGKSVCINTIIISILYKYSPEEVRLILIDPKVVELSVYNSIPHLLIPVVTDARKASRALYMAVQEMERRFRLFSQYSVRDIDSYRERRSVETDMENLPYIVVIVDELSDLMMVASKDVEAHITRLAQMARACGIHLIIATQRPSVDVITGTIKANITSRISFQVSSGIDSRTILDQTGAERLLGKGDMLYFPSTYTKPKRVQGAFVSDREVQNVVQFLTDNHEVHYDKNLMKSIDKSSEASAEGEKGDEVRDALMDEVIEFISHEDTTSISGLQRRFRIGYSRAGRIIDDLESMGYISGQDGSKPREVLIREDNQGSEE